MAERKLGKKRVVEFLVLIAIVAVCLYFMILMLMNAHPHIEPGVKSGGGHTSSLSPIAPASRPHAAADATRSLYPRRLTS